MEALQAGEDGDDVALSSDYIKYRNNIILYIDIYIYIYIYIYIL